MLSIVAAHINVLNNSTALRSLLTSGISYLGQHGVIVLFIHLPSTRLGRYGGVGLGGIQDGGKVITK